MMFRETLSEREKQVAAHLAAGLRVAGVARELCLAENTVRNHLKNAFSKLDVHSQSELIELVRTHPSTVAPYQTIADPATGTERDLIDEIEEVDRAAEKRVEECAASGEGLDRMKAMLRAVLPLDDTRRREWRVRLGAHVVGAQQRAVRDAAGEIHRKWASKPLLRIEEFQERGWVRRDLEAQEVRRRLFSAVYAAALALLADGSETEQAAQLAVIDRLLEELSPPADDRP